jgi:hypothetical protein
MINPTVTPHENRGDSNYRPESHRPFDADKDYPIFLRYCLEFAAIKLAERVKTDAQFDGLKKFSCNLFIGVDQYYRGEVGGLPQNPREEDGQRMAQEIKARLSDAFRKRGKDFSAYLKLMLAVRKGNASIYLRGIDCDVKVIADYTVDIN